MRSEDFSPKVPGEIRKILGSGFCYWAFIPNPLPVKLEYNENLVFFVHLHVFKIEVSSIHSIMMVALVAFLRNYESLVVT